MSGWFSLNLSGTESGLMSEMPSETGNWNQLQRVKEKTKQLCSTTSKEPAVICFNL
jgi:hypothetical protein